MQQTSHVYPDFENPPVVEVVCGIQFKTINKLLVPHLGLLWEEFKPDYPECQEVAPLSPVFELFEGEQQRTFGFQEVPPLPRIWFIHKSDNGIIQVQRDKFLHNWRKVLPENEYPRYPFVIEMFKNRLAQFESFLSDNGFGKLEPNQYEMTYINHIWIEEVWNSLSEIGKVFPDFSFRINKKRFLPEPENINWRTSFLLPNKAGRMHVTIRNAKRRSDQKPMILMDLTVRGFSDNGMETWFDLAREWIVCGFADLTGKDIQAKVWRRLN
ncbi:MAG: TIGR04255 family protein [Candidatus Kariarchaeaceae archaeon]|jgi:uncharacterized protein (TIGR04255 family)